MNGGLAGSYSCDDRKSITTGHQPGSYFFCFDSGSGGEDGISFGDTGEYSTGLLPLATSSSGEIGVCSVLDGRADPKGEELLRSLKPRVGLSISTSMENSCVGAVSRCGIVTAEDARTLPGDGNLGIMKGPEDRFDILELFLDQRGETEQSESKGCEARPPVF